MLELRSIGKRLGPMEMSGVSLAVNPSEYFVLLGPSGVGKTVLIEIIAGLTRPDTGKIFWEGKDITGAPPEARGFAVVYQDYALFPHLTAAKNIAYGLGAAGVDSDTVTERLRLLAGMLHIGHIMDRRPETLSGGEKQRVALARALAPRPRLLLLDEPLSALDTNTRVYLRKELKRINRELATPVFHVTHDPEEAMALGDRVGVMLNHTIRQTAAPEELFRKPSESDVAEFLGMRNVLPVSAVNGRLCTTSGVQLHVSSANGSTSHIWISPEKILLSRRPFDSSARNQFKCRVVEWEHCDSLLAVHVACGELTLTALITYASFKELEIADGGEVFATFKSSAVHCF